MRGSSATAMTSIWASWGYHYGVGGALFAVSLVVLVRSGAVDLKQAEHRRWVVRLSTGLVGFAALHAAWIAAGGGR